MSLCSGTLNDGEGVGPSVDDDLPFRRTLSFSTFPVRVEGTRSIIYVQGTDGELWTFVSLTNRTNVLFGVTRHR